MLDIFRTKSKTGSIAYSTGIGGRRHAKLLQPGERGRLIAFGIGATCFFLLFISVLGRVTTRFEPLREPTPLPDLQALGSFPSQEQLAATQAQVTALAAEPEHLATVLTYNRLDDPVLLGSAEQHAEQDRLQPPKSTGTTIADLAQIEQGGMAIFTIGRLVDKAACGASNPASPWQVLTLESHDAAGQAMLLLVISRSDQEWVVGGPPLRVAGRLLGQRNLPLRGDATAARRLPVVYAAALCQGAADAADMPLLACPGLDGPPDGPTAVPWDLIAEADLSVEQRPYYAVLGAARHGPEQLASLAPADASSVRQASGTITAAWWDPEVARDHPWGIAGVQRIRFLENASQGTQRVIEAALVCGPGAELPALADEITVDGICFKQLVVPDPRAATDPTAPRALRCHPFLIAATYRIEPAPRPGWGWPGWTALALSTAFLAMVVVVARRDRQHDDSWKTPVRRLRTTRRRLLSRAANPQDPATPPAS